MVVAGFKKQAEKQRSQLQKSSWLSIEDLKKELKGKGKEVSKAEQAAYKLRQKETEEGLKSQLTEVWWGFCLQVWVEALNTAWMDPSLELRNPEKVIIPFALKSTTNSSTPETSFAALTSQPPAEGRKRSKAMD